MFLQTINQEHKLYRLYFTMASPSTTLLLLRIQIQALNQSLILKVKHLHSATKAQPRVI